MTRYLATLPPFTIIMLGLTSCSERIAVVSKSPDEGIVVYEGRQFGAGPAADYLAVYLLTAPNAPAADTEPILEAQDAGRVCYEWLSPTALNIRISGGYVDHVTTQWVGQNGRHIEVRYLGNSGCGWRQS